MFKLYKLFKNHLIDTCFYLHYLQTLINNKYTNNFSLNVLQKKLHKNTPVQLKGYLRF